VSVKAKTLTLRQAYNLLTLGFEAYALAHRETYLVNIGDDPLVSEAWLNIGEALIELLNTDVGDAATNKGDVEAAIVQVMEEHGLIRVVELERGEKDE